jgi:hypothetical protein
MTPKEMKATYRQVLNDKDGAFVIDDLEKRFNVNSTSFSKDPYETAFREGQRDVVLFIKSSMKEQKES